MLRRATFLGLLLACAATPAAGQSIRREAAPNAAIANSVELPAGSRIVYVSGTVPDVADPAAARGSPQRYGNTAAQTRSVLRTIESRLKAHGMTLGDVVMMRVFLVRPPGAQAMDFAGMMTAYREYFGTAAQPNRPARSTMEVAGLVDPDWLVEIEVTAARPPATGRGR
jgi:enamine deaminase RidA (YjgF/YER057c/UK114 family)